MDGANQNSKVVQPPRVLIVILCNESVIDNQQCVASIGVEKFLDLVLKWHRAWRS